MATEEEVEAVLEQLVQRISRIDPSYRAMLPTRRTIQAECPDIGVVYHTDLRQGRLSGLQRGSAPRADIRLRCSSDDLLLLAAGELDPSVAYASDRLSIQASVTDLLRLRAVL
ncbi:MAG: SCP2 sterol-binding domain-containing protein [Actinobacteria bacterium]|nr:SCP2 sterol-binding domain-containing protein [Actinomycetota bacterium]